MILSEKPNMMLSEEEPTTTTMMMMTMTTATPTTEALNIIQLFISSCVFIGLSILIIAILKSQQTRTQPYNIYLVMLELVDAIMNIMLIIQIFYFWSNVVVVPPPHNEELELRLRTTPPKHNHNQQHQHHNDGFGYDNIDVMMDPKIMLEDHHPESDTDDDLVELMWIMTNGIVIFATFVNMYLSAIVACRIYKLLYNSHRALRVQTQPIRTVLLESCVVYTIGIILAVLYCVSEQKPITTTTTTTKDDEDNDVDDESNENFVKVWSLVISLVIVIPLAVVLYVTILIYRQRLLPISADPRTRTIAIYFGRIVFVFIVFCVPGMILFSLGLSRKIFGNNKENYDFIWIRIIGTILFSLQGGFSFFAALTKPDIYDAVMMFVKCNKQQSSPGGGCNNNNNDNDNDNTINTM